MRGVVRFLLWFAALLVVLGVVARLTVMKVWTIPDDPVLGLSMAPTLNAGDTVILWTVGERAFGELVRCPDPEDPQRWVVGRIVGMSGDVIEVSQGILKVNGTRYNVSDACQTSQFTLTDEKGNTFEATCSRVEMAGGWHFRSMVKGHTPERVVKHEVGPGRFYLLSDNRSLHDDSRDFGAIDAATCKELISFRLWDHQGFFSADQRFEYVH
jgi:signal peptidase I